MENNEREIDLIALSKAAWKKRGTIIKYGVIGCVTGIVIAISLPKEYNSTIKIVLENKADNSGGSMGALADLMGVNVNGVQNEGVNENIYPEIIKSTPFAMEFAHIQVQYKNEPMPMYEYIFDYQKKPWWSYVIEAPGALINLFSSQNESDTVNISNSAELKRAFVTTFAQKIKVGTDKTTKVYTITATAQDPAISKLIADSLLVKLQHYITSYRTAKTKQNLEQNTAALSQVRQYYYDTDSLYANTQDRNQNLVSKSAQVRLERLRNERDLAFSIYKQLATQVEMDRVKLQEETPIATVIEPSYEPIIPAKPNRKLIIAALTLLGLFAASATIVIREIISNQKS